MQPNCMCPIVDLNANNSDFKNNINSTNKMSEQNNYNSNHITNQQYKFI